MRMIAALMLSLLILGCHQDSAEQENRITDPERLARLRMLPPPEAFVRPQDQQAVRRLRSGYEAPMPCGNLGLNEHIDHCYRFGLARRWQGLWRDDFEGSEFCEAPAKECRYSTPGTSTWLSFANARTGEPAGALYAMDFIGRHSVYAGIGMYGHFGMSAHEIIVDRVISMKELEPPPPPPTKAEMRAWDKECEASDNCWTNEELKKRGWNKK